MRSVAFIVLISNEVDPSNPDENKYRDKAKKELEKLIEKARYAKHWKLESSSIIDEK